MPLWISKLKRRGHSLVLSALSTTEDPARGTSEPSSRLEAGQLTVGLKTDEAATSVGKANESPLQNPETAGDNFWDRAWDSIQQDTKHTKLFKEYEKALLSACEDADVSMASTIRTPHSGRQEQVKRLVTRALRDVDKKKMILSVGSKELVVRDQLDRIIKALLFAESAVTAAVNSQPIAAVAWSGVCLMVNLLSNSSTERTALIEGLDYVTRVICRFSVVEDVYRQQQEHDPASVEQAKAVEFAVALIKVYSQILLYQMHVVAQLSRSKLSQLGRDVIKSNDWAELLASIESAEAEFDQRRQILDSGRLNRGMSQQDQQMDKILEGHSMLVKLTGATLEIVREQERHSRTEHENRCHAAFRVSDYVSDKDRNPRRVPGTCGWFKDHENYQKWRCNDEKDLLWVSADPGCRKSVLSRFLVEDLLPVEGTSIYYFFFKDEGKEQKSAASAVRALLHQLYTDKPALIKHALPVFNKEGEKIQTLFSELWAILRASVTDPTAGNTICVLDALDECKESGRILLIDSLKQFHRNSGWNGTNGFVKFLVTSRPYQSIERKFRVLENALPQSRLAGEDETESIKEEIDLVIKDRVGGLRDDLELDSRVAGNLESKLLSMDHRTYLFEEVVGFIDVIPETVEEAYEGILNGSTDKRLARKILNMVVAAQRPLTLREMDVTLAIGDHTKSEAELDLEGDKNLGNNVRNLCGLFLNITDSKVYLIHQTAREFLIGTNDNLSAETTPHMWKHSVSATESNELLAKVCLQYLSVVEFNHDPLDVLDLGPYLGPFSCWKIDCDSVDNYARKYAFLDYSTKFWITHVQKAEVQDDSPLLRAMAHLYDAPSNRFPLLCLADPAIVHSPNPSSLPPVAIATIYGLVPLLRLLLNQGGDVNAKADSQWTALHFAAERENAEIVGLLLDFGAEVSAETKYAKTPLHYVAQYGHLSAVRLLLAHGAYIDAADRYDKTCLIHAAENGHLEFVKLLLDKGVDIEASGSLLGTALNYAAANGHSEIVKQLRSKGATIDAVGIYEITPLMCAARGGHHEVVKLLLGNGADVNATECRYGATALSYVAAHYGYETGTSEIVPGLKAVMGELLAHSADPTKRRTDGKTALELIPKECTGMRALLEAAEAEYTSSHSLQKKISSDTEKDQLEVVSERREPTMAM